MIYKIGHRLDKTKNALFIITGILLFFFYFIYNYFFNPNNEESISRFIIIILVILFIVFLFAIDKGISWYSKSVQYTLENDGVSCCLGRRKFKVKWDDFAEASMDYTSLTGIGNVRFILKNGKLFKINQSVEKYRELSYKILLEIKDIATIQDGLIEKMSDLKKL